MVKRTMLLSAIGLLVAGCRAATQVTEVPRVDLALEGGNRGYLVGTPPSEEASWKTTRQMVQTDIEIPSAYRQTRREGQAVLDEFAPPETESEETPTSEELAGPYDTYEVQRGDSLWTIAAKPEIYGKATKWRRIFDANRHLLKSPDKVRPGMVLKIPRGQTTQQTDEGTLFKK